jgi:hypothetical protein
MADVLTYRGKRIIGPPVAAINGVGGVKFLANQLGSPTLAPRPSANWPTAPSI